MQYFSELYMYTHTHIIRRVDELLLALKKTTFGPRASTYSHCRWLAPEKNLWIFLSHLFAYSKRNKGRETSINVQGKKRCAQWLDDDNNEGRMLAPDGYIGVQPGFAEKRTIWSNSKHTIKAI